jgi:hypothetical protein
MRVGEYLTIGLSDVAGRDDPVDSAEMNPILLTGARSGRQAICALVTDRGVELLRGVLR